MGLLSDKAYFVRLSNVLIEDKLIRQPDGTWGFRRTISEVRSNTLGYKCQDFGIELMRVDISFVSPSLLW